MATLFVKGVLRTSSFLGSLKPLDKITWSPENSNLGGTSVIVIFPSRPSYQLLPKYQLLSYHFGIFRVNFDVSKNPLGFVLF